MKSFSIFLDKIVFSCNISCFSKLNPSIYKLTVSYLTQKTINENITLKGIGLHSGLEAEMTIKPAEPNTGIIFKRIDLKENNYYSKYF